MKPLLPGHIPPELHLSFPMCSSSQLPYLQESLRNSVRKTCCSAASTQQLVQKKAFDVQFCQPLSMCKYYIHSKSVQIIFQLKGKGFYAMSKGAQKMDE